MKRIVTVQDISCVGKCSLTVALPIISAMGVETAVIPTAVLSTHTAFKNFTFRDLTNDIPAIVSHWQQEQIGFDAIYTGYLGSFEQLQLVSNIFDEFRTDNNLVFIDPVMADHGKLYSGFTQEFADQMAKLCGKADIIVPNLTEAAFMLREPYAGEGYDENDIRVLLKKLCGLGAKKAVLTGISFAEDQLGVMAYDSEKQEYFSYFNKRLPVSFHGTGDVFASCCLGGLMNGLSLEEALRVAVDYTGKTIETTLADSDHHWYGVNFEQTIAYLIKRLEQARQLKV